MFAGLVLASGRWFQRNLSQRSHAAPKEEVIEERLGVCQISKSRGFDGSKGIRSAAPLAGSAVFAVE